MYSYIFLLITFCQLVVSYPYKSSGIDSESTGYIISPGIGAHNYHKSMVTWNEARKFCIEEGGHLAVIESAAEEAIIAKYQTDNDLSSMWIGYHDLFKKDYWVTVLDQGIDTIGYKHWRTGEPNGVNNNERCVTYDRTGLNDLNCNQNCMFICKINLNQ